MLDRRRRDVTLFEMIDKSTYLAQIKFDELEEDNYWTMLDREGQILKIDPEMHDILNNNDWLSLVLCKGCIHT